MSGIHIRAQAVIQIFDDFSGKAVGAGMVRPVLTQNAWMVAKENGIYVLGGLVPDQNSGKCVIELKSPVYESFFCELPVASGECPCIRVRMTPSASMPVPPGTTVLEGKEEPGTRVMVICIYPASEMKLLKDAQGEKIQIYREHGEELGGRTIAFFEKGKFSEAVRVVYEDEGFSVLEQPVKKIYRRAGTGIYCVQEIKTDDRGNFYLWLNRIPDSGCECVILTEKNGEIIREYKEQIQPGIRNRFSAYETGKKAGKREDK